MDQIKEITAAEIAKAIASMKKAHAKASDSFAATISVDNVEAVLNMCIGLNEREITSMICLLSQLLSLPHLAVLLENFQITVKYKMYEGV